MTDQTHGAPSDSDAKTRTERDAAAASIALFAFVLNYDGALERCHRWLIGSGALHNDIPTASEYRWHLETMLHFVLLDYHDILRELGEEDQLMAEEATGQPTNARMTSTPNCVPLRKEGRAQNGVCSTGRRDSTRI